MKEFIVYPDNKGCVDGVFIDRDGARMLMNHFGIRTQRPVDATFHKGGVTVKTLATSAYQGNRRRPASSATKRRR